MTTDELIDNVQKLSERIGPGILVALPEQGRLVRVTETDNLRQHDLLRVEDGDEQDDRIEAIADAVNLLPALAAELRKLSAPIDVKRGDVRLMLDPTRRDVMDAFIGDLMLEAERMSAELRRLREVVSRLPVTADGVPIHLNDCVWWKPGAGEEVELVRVVSISDEADGTRLSILREDGTRISPVVPGSVKAVLARPAAAAALAKGGEDAAK